MVLRQITSSDAQFMFPGPIQTHIFKPIGQMDSPRDIVITGGDMRKNTLLQVFPICLKLIYSEEAVYD